MVEHDGAVLTAGAHLGSVWSWIWLQVACWAWWWRHSGLFSYLWLRPVLNLQQQICAIDGGGGTVGLFSYLLLRRVLNLQQQNLCHWAIPAPCLPNRTLPTLPGSRQLYPGRQANRPLFLDLRQQIPSMLDISFLQATLNCAFSSENVCFAKGIMGARHLGGACVYSAVKMCVFNFVS